MFSVVILKVKCLFTIITPNWNFSCGSAFCTQICILIKRKFNNQCEFLCVRISNLTKLSENEKRVPIPDFQILLSYV